ncbi:hypothetical protein AAOE16_06445 [Ekhidna sp. MALMAid0563]|uniref:hypothetical protein n=1 Tax=Ekhidna sp. MALMAid0563 TaxID=3143937 RepID=UPI0032DF14C7
MKKYIKSKVLIIAVLLISVGCEDFEPNKNIENPNLLLENVIGSPGSTASWIVGQEREMAILYNQLLTLTELGSDNYENTQTFYNQQFDGLNMSFQDTEINTLAFRIADLRVSGNIGLQDIQPADPDGTDAQRAELLFFTGWAKLLAGELFVSLPDTELPEADPATPKSPTENLQAAIVDFLAAEALDGTNAGIKLALARAYYALGDQTNAVTKANEALALDDEYVRTVEFDGSNGPTNTMADAVFQRGNFDDLQPLPRLDFLDPKYIVLGEDESPIAIQKSEEAYLILAEAELADSDIPGAQAALTSLLSLVNTRPSHLDPGAPVQDVTFDDAVEGRVGGGSIQRPNADSVTVAASDSDPFVAGLVLTRGVNPVAVPAISGTSVVQADIDALATIEDALELVYLMRQEIFFGEGRRFFDLGLKMPISENEQLTNPNVSSSDIQSFIPSFIPADMDAFTIDAANGQITITHNMNAVIVQNRTDNSVVPFF